MKMSEEMAVRLHRMMWSEMQRELGDNPSGGDRIDYKREWVKRNFPGEPIANDCWLCEYALSKACRIGGDPYCKYCPISWPNCHCNTLDFSYATAPISDILALPAKNEKINADAVAFSYYKYREDLLSKASGRPTSTSIDDHVKAIQEKAVEEYFDKTPGAKLATMDVDQAFKQYADEQKAPIFRALAEASGLSSGNESVKAHISEIRSNTRSKGRAEMATEIFETLYAYSGVSKNNWSVGAHVDAIREKAKEQMEPLRKTSMHLADKLNSYKDKLSEQSGLDRNRPVDDHICEIVTKSMEAGATEERDRIMDKIKEVLNQ